MLTTDAAGNVIADGVHTFTFDAENHLLSTAQTGQTTVTYKYDGRGSGFVLANPECKKVERVQKSSGVIYWYGLSSQPLVETSLTGGTTNAYYLFPGFGVCTCKPRFNEVRLTNRRPWSHVFNLDTYVLDALGSTNLVSGLNLSGSGAWDYSDYYPYGGEWAHQSAIGNHYKFTGKERDSESNLDDFGARFYASSLGRWLSADLPFVDQDSLRPQSLNLYGYVRNSPTNAIDADGRLTIVIPGTWWKPEEWNANNPLMNEAPLHFHETYHTQLLLWDPRGNSDNDRAHGARMLADYINNYKFAPGEKLYVIAHSHGGSVALQAAKLGLSHKIDELITLGTPLGYGEMGSGIGDWYNITGDGDWVQPNASRGCWTTTGCSQPSGAHNYTVHAGGHSQLWNNQDVRRLWWDWYMTQHQNQTSKPSATNPDPPAPSGRRWPF